MDGVSQFTCVAEFVALKTIELSQSIIGTRGDVTLWKFKANSHYTRLHCYTASISMIFYDCCSFELRRVKLPLIQSVLRCTIAHPRPCQNCPGTCRLPRHPQDVEYKRSTSGAYLWWQHSNVNSSPGQCRCRAVSRWWVLPARKPPLVSPVAADIIKSLLGGSCRLLSASTFGRKFGTFHPLFQF